MRARPPGRTSGEKQHRNQSARLPGKHVHHLHLGAGHDLPGDRRQNGAHIHPDGARGAGLIRHRHTPADGIGLWNPVLTGYVYILERRVVECKKIWIQTTNGWRQVKSRWIADGFPIFAETQENAHRFCTQPIGGLKRKRGRLSAAQAEFPDMVIEIIRNGKA